jgi:hypothetical protein
MIGGSDCRMVTPGPGKDDNILGQLEKFYKYFRWRYMF